jgi:hypothetical protein
LHTIKVHCIEHLCNSDHIKSASCKQGRQAHELGRISNETILSACSILLHYSYVQFKQELITVHGTSNTLIQRQIGILQLLLGLTLSKRKKMLMLTMAAWISARLCRLTSSTSACRRQFATVGKQHGPFNWCV